MLPSSFCHQTGYLKELYIYTYARSIKSRDYFGRSSSFLVCSLWFLKTRLFSAIDVISIDSNSFLMLCNHTGMVVPHAFHSCWKLFTFDQIQLDAYCTVVWRWFEATFKLRTMIPIFEINEMTETQCLVLVFLLLVCLFPVFFPGDCQFYEEDTLLWIGPCYNVWPLFCLNNVNWKL